MELDDD
jgi:hypothetical protein